MFGIARIALASVAIATAGTGTAVLACSSSPPSGADVSAKLAGRATADLSAAQKAHDEAIAALASTDAAVKAQGEALIEASATKLEKASVDMKAAVDAGSETAVDGIASFAGQTTKLVNSLATTAAGTASASVQTGVRLTNAVDAQLAAARSVATASGTAAVKTLTETKVALPQISLPSANAAVSAGARSNTSASTPSANAVSSTTGQLGITLGG